MKAREYAGPLGVLAAGAIGFSLLCSVSAMAMGDLNNRISVTMEPLNIVNLAVSNLETAAALTEQVVTVFVPTQTFVPTATASAVPLPSDTSTSTSTPRRFVTITPTGTRRARPTFTSTSIPTRPPTALPTRTPIPPTNTLIPTLTATPVPPTNTIPPTDTSVPPTDTSVPPTDPPTPVDTLPPDTPIAPGALFPATPTPA